MCTHVNRLDSDRLADPNTTKTCLWHGPVLILRPTIHLAPTPSLVRVRILLSDLAACYIAPADILLVPLTVLGADTFGAYFLCPAVIFILTFPVFIPLSARMVSVGYYS